MSRTCLSAFGLEGGVAAVVGAGGKTTLLFRLADEAHAAGLRVLITSTTHMGVPSGHGPVVYEDGGDATPALAAALAGEGRATLLGRRRREDKVEGIPPERVDALARAADLVLVEADGARRRSFKVPADHEPVVPASAALVIVVAGLDVLGRPLDETYVHRCDRVAAAAGQAMGSAVTEETIARALADPSGYLARVSRGVRSAVFLNKAEDAAARSAAARLAARLSPPYGVAVAGSARDGVLSAGG